MAAEMKRYRDINVDGDVILPLFGLHGSWGVILKKGEDRRYILAFSRLDKFVSWEIPLLLALSFTLLDGCAGVFKTQKRLAIASG
jgi:hypothetical protein